MFNEKKVFGMNFSLLPSFEQQESTFAGDWVTIGVVGVKHLPKQLPNGGKLVSWTLDDLQKYSEVSSTLISPAIVSS